MAALDDQIRDTVGRLLDSLRGRLESDLGSCQDELIRAAQDASARIAADAADEAAAEARREAELQLTELRESSARDAQEQRERLTGEISELQHRLDDARRELDDARREFDETRGELDETRRDLEDSQKQTAAAREEHAAATRQEAAAREEIATLTKELESARQELDATRDDVEATLRDIEMSRRDTDAARVEIRRLTDVLRGKDECSAQSMRLPDAVRALDEATTFGEVLDSLAVRAGREAGRAAVFLVKEGRLRDWRTVGFALPSDSSRLDLELGESGPMAEAVRSAEGIHPRNGNSLPAFARTDESREAAAWPISVGGSVVAVLYADSPVADKAEEPYWPAFLDVLARHAGRVLEGITVRQAAGLGAGKASGMTPSPVSRQSSGSLQ